jgi:hypothetical protein
MNRREELQDKCMRIFLTFPQETHNQIIKKKLFIHRSMFQAND